VKSLLALSVFPLAGWMALMLPSNRVTGSLEPLLRAAAQDAPAATVAPTPPDTKNPVKATADTRAKAKKMYGYDCAMCHGESGDGKTDLAAEMGPGLTDLTDPKTLAGKSDAEIFDIIKNGKGKMPAEDLRRAKLDDLWSLVIYVRGMAKK